MGLKLRLLSNGCCRRSQLCSLRFTRSRSAARSLRSSALMQCSRNQMAGGNWWSACEVCWRSAQLLKLRGSLAQPLPREREHSPSDTHADHQKQKQGPQDIFDAVDWLAPAKKSKRNGNECRK